MNAEDFHIFWVFMVIACLGAFRCAETPHMPLDSDTVRTVHFLRSDLEPVVLSSPDLASKNIQHRIIEREALLLERAGKAGATVDELVDACGELGKVYMAAGFHDLAVNCFNNARRLNPYSFRWAYYLAHVFCELGKLDEAINNGEDAVRLDPEYRAAHTFLGELYLDANELEKADAVFLGVLKNWPASAAAWYGTGRIALMRKDYQDAVLHLKTAIALQPRATLFHHSLGQAYRGLNMFEQARYHMSRAGTGNALPSDPLMAEIVLANVDACAQKGRQALRSGNFPEALKLLEFACAADPDNYMNPLSLGSVYAAQGRIDEALIEFRRALALNSQTFHVHYQIGWILVERGQYDEAIEHLQRAIALEPGHIVSHSSLGVAYERLEQLDKAVACYEKVVSLDPKRIRARLQMALVLEKMGKCERAIATVERAIDLFPNDLMATELLLRLMIKCSGDRTDRIKPPKHPAGASSGVED